MSTQSLADRNNTNQLNPLYERDIGDWQSPSHVTTNPPSQHITAPESSSNRNASSNTFDKPPPPGFGGKTFPIETSLTSALSASAKDPGTYLGSHERRLIGECLYRSQSAAPSYDAQLTTVPTPGLAHSNTPLASNTSHPHIQDAHLRSLTDKPSIQELGQRRSASTGVIGEQQQDLSLIHI